MSGGGTRDDHDVVRRAGIDPHIFEKPEENMVLVVANVPDRLMSIVQEGQSCTAQLYGYPGVTFNGHVERIGATVGATERPSSSVIIVSTQNLGSAVTCSTMVSRAFPR